MVVVFSYSVPRQILDCSWKFSHFGTTYFFSFSIILSSLDTAFFFFTVFSNFFFLQLFWTEYSYLKLLSSSCQSIGKINEGFVVFFHAACSMIFVVRIALTWKLAVDCVECLIYVPIWIRLRNPFSHDRTNCSVPNYHNFMTHYTFLQMHIMNHCRTHLDLIEVRNWKLKCFDIPKLDPQVW